MWDSAVWVSLAALAIHVGLLAAEIVLLEEDDCGE